MGTSHVPSQFAMAQPRIQPLKPGRAVLGFTPAFFTKLAPNLALWGFAGVGAIAVIASGIPRFQRDVLDMVPGVRSYYVSCPLPSALDASLRLQPGLKLA